MGPLQIILLSLLTLHNAHGSDIDMNVDVANNNVQDLFKREAEVELKTETSSPFKYPYFFEIKDQDEIVARLNLTKGAFQVDLVKTGKKDNYQQIHLETAGRSIKKYANFTFDNLTPTVTASKTGSSESGMNSSKIDITFSYSDAAKDGDNTEFVVKSADLKFTVEWGVLTRRDYWNITSVSVSMKTSVNNTDKNFDVDLTPKMSYTGSASDSACGTGYGICAPIGLCWTCSDQVLSPNKLSDIGENELTVMWHMRGMVLEPEWGNTKTVSADKFKFSFNWDCDPLLPLSLWVSILITLFLAFILVWAINMLSALKVPSKWDDPKKPGIHVAQSE